MLKVSTATLKEAWLVLESFSPSKALLKELKELSEEIIDFWLDDEAVNSFQEMYFKFSSVASKYAVQLKSQLENPLSSIYSETNVEHEDWSFSHEFGIEEKWIIASKLSEDDIADVMFLFALGFIYLEKNKLKVIPEFLSLIKTK